jgi:anti-sigma B factor antagonist
VLTHCSPPPAPAGGSIGTSALITSRVAGGRVNIGLAGEIDATNVDRLRTALFTHLDQGRTEVVVDISALTFIDCAGLAVIRAAAAYAQRIGGSMRLGGTPHPSVRRLLQLTGKVAAMPERTA